MCWLGLLLIRLAENATSMTWRDIHREMSHLHAVTLTDGAAIQISTLTEAQ